MITLPENINWDAVSAIGTLSATIVALCLGLIAVFSRGRERKEYLKKVKRSTMRLRFQIATELLYLKNFLETTQRKHTNPQRDKIDFGSNVDQKYKDALQKLELYYGQSALLNDSANNNLETVLHFLQIIVNQGRLSREHFDRLLNAVSKLRRELWGQKLLVSKARN